MSHIVENQDRHGDGDRTFYCDALACDEQYDGFGSFIEVWERAYAAGWHCSKEGKTWSHFCFEHAKEAGR